MNVDQAITVLETASARADDERARAHLASLREVIGQDLALVERDLPAHLGRSVYPLVEASQHLLRAGGKRVRPVLVLLGGRAVGVTGEPARKLACAGELVHLATLLHDDVIDDGDVRRGVETPRRLWSNTASVLAGDFVLTRALDLVSSVDSPRPLKEAIATLRELVEGEVLQLEMKAAGGAGLDEYLMIVEKKTASLFRWCCRAAAHLGEDAAAVNALGDFGAALGVAFQVVDDLLDFSGDPAETGKALLTDLREGKMTLPVLLAAERQPSVRDRVAEIAAGGDPPTGGLVALRGEIIATGAVEETRRFARQRTDDARAALERVPAGESRNRLAQIASLLAGRVS